MFPLILIAFLAYSWKPGKQKKQVQTTTSPSTVTTTQMVQSPPPLQPRVNGGGGSFLTSPGGQLLASSLARRIAPPGSGVAIASDIAAGLGVAKLGVDVVRETLPLFKRDVPKSSPAMTPRYTTEDVGRDWTPVAAVDEVLPEPPISSSVPELDWSGLPQYDPSLEPVISIPEPTPITETPLEPREVTPESYSEYE